MKLKELLERWTTKTALFEPARTIMVSGPIDAKLVSELTPRILELRTSPDPITVVIDSPGGSVARTQTLFDLLSVSPDDEEPPQLITVVTGTAHSAAADLLCAGDFAIAYPNARIFAHGVRAFSEQVTEETASLLSTSLRDANDWAAKWMARPMFRRMLDNYVRLRPGFADALSQDVEALRELPELSAEGGIDLRGFTAALWHVLEPPYDEIVLDALHEVAHLDSIGKACQGDGMDLPACVEEAVGNMDDEESREDTRSRLRVLHAIIADRIKQDPSFDLTSEALDEISALYDYATEAASPYFQDDVLALLVEHGSTFFPSEDLEEVSAIAETADPDNLEQTGRFDELVGQAYERAAPLWAFTLAVSRGLKHGEHPIDSEDAWWLGLIDLVLESDLDRRVT